MDRRRTWLVIVAMSLLPAGTVRAQDEKIAEPKAHEAGQPAQVPDLEQEASDLSFSFDATFASKYVWRGINITDGWVFQPSATLGYKGFSFNVWGNEDLIKDNGEHGNFTEVDLTADYSFSWEKLDFSVGSITYLFPQGGQTTTEIYGGVGLDVLLAPTVTVYQDVDESHGTYLNFSVGHTFEDVVTITEDVKASVELGTSVGFGSSNNNEFNYGADEAGFTDWQASVGVPIAFGEHVTFTPALSYSTLLDGGIRSVSDEDDNLWVTLTLGMSF